MFYKGCDDFGIEDYIIQDDEFVNQFLGDCTTDSNINSDIEINGDDIPFTNKDSDDILKPGEYRFPFFFVISERCMPTTGFIFFYF